MSLGAEKLADLRVKHLDMAQSVVSRMAGQGAVLKNYCLTLTTAVCGFAITLKEPVVALAALLPVFIFAILDAQYLRLERRFRRLFEEVQSGDWKAVPSFSMRPARKGNDSYWAALSSWSIVIFYAPLAVAVIIVVFVASKFYG